MLLFIWSLSPKTNCNASLGTLVTTSNVELCSENKKDMTPKVRGDFSWKKSRTNTTYLLANTSHLPKP